jgi:hypothetical protein
MVLNIFLYILFVLIAYYYALNIALNISKSVAMSWLFASIKIVIFLVFTLILDPKDYLQPDSVKYIRQAGEISELIASGYSFDEVLNFAYSQVGGWHIGFNLFLSLIFYLFGNDLVLITALIFLLSLLSIDLFGRIAVRIPNFYILPPNYALLLLSPAILLFSVSFIGKDLLVNFLISLFLFLAINLRRDRPILMDQALIVLILFAMWFLRFYMIVPLVLVLFVTPTFSITKWPVLKIIYLISLFFITYLFIIDNNGLGQKIFDIIAKSDYLSISLGIFRYLLSPNPFNIESSYSIYTFSSIANLALIPFSLIGILSVLFKRSMVTNSLLVFTGSTIFIYALIPELQGIRHRISVELPLIIFSSIGIQLVIMKLHKIRHV